MSIQLSNSYLEKDAIRAPNFFNGRLLSAEDLSAERDALLRRLAQLGRAAGDGIAYGLEVTGVIGGSSATDPVVSVSAGLALNREGQAIELNHSVDVSLLEPASGGSSDTAAAAGAGAFGNCSPIETSAYAAGKGLYLLAIAPSQGREGRAALSGLGNLTACCGDKSLVDGVSFRLIRLDVSATDLNDARLQNRAAHLCFGTADAGLQTVAANLFGTPVERYGLVDALRRDGRLGDSEVPLALIHWVNGTGTRFVDGWAVRRRLVRPAALDRYAPLVGERRAAEQEALSSQFQAQIEAISVASRRSTVATELFDYLPPAGVLPLSLRSTDAGFDYLKFFTGITLRQQFSYIEAARLRWLLRMALDFPPIDLTSAVGRQRLVWHYLVRENRQAANGANGVQAYLVFARGDVPYVGDPHYDANHWDFSNYAIGPANAT